MDHRQNRRIKQRGGQIVAYAVVSGNDILEILGNAKNVLATEQLLSRICADAVERNVQTIHLPAPASGNWLTEICTTSSSSSKMQNNKLQHAGIACVPSEKLLIRRLGPELMRRWRPVFAGRSAELGWGLGERSCRLTLSDKGAKLLTGGAGSDRLICSHQIWMRLLIGELNAPAAFAADLLEASTPTARRLAETLFPELPVWRPAWDNSICI